MGSSVYLGSWRCKPCYNNPSTITLSPMIYAASMHALRLWYIEQESLVFQAMIPKPVVGLYM